MKIDYTQRAKISLPVPTSLWIRDLQKKHEMKHKIPLSLSQIVAMGMELAKKALTADLTK